MKRLISTTILLSIIGTGYSFASDTEFETGRGAFSDSRYVFYITSNFKAGLEASKKDLEGLYTREGAISACNSLKENGFDDWFLPPSEVLENYRFGRVTSCEGLYWSSSTDDFGGININLFIYSDGHGPEYGRNSCSVSLLHLSKVRCIRAFLTR